MSSFRDTMTTLLRSEGTQALARHAPLALVATVSGGIIGAAIGARALAAAGLGMVLTSLATNMTNMVSSLLYEVIDPDVDDDTRSTAIQRGLEAGDPHVTALVLDALTALGPQLAESLAAVQRPALLPALSAGMQQAGGPLTTLAPQISAALADSQADWGPLQQRVASSITSLDMRVRTKDGARVSGQKQRAENAAGRISMSIEASGTSVIENGEQTVIGAAQPSGAASGSATTGAALPNDPAQLRALLAATIARLNVRELQRAQYGIDAPPHVVTELADLRAEVTRLRAALGV